MKITHYIMPRGSGKTATCRKEMLGDGCLILPTPSALLHPYKLMGKYYNKIVIDDYIRNLMCLSKGDRQRIYNNVFDILAPRCKALQLYSTPVKKYSRESLMLSELLARVENFNDFKTDLFDDSDIFQEVDEITQCFLNPYKVNIVKDVPYVAPRDKNKNLEAYFGKEKYDIQINCNFIKE